MATTEKVIYSFEAVDKNVLDFFDKMKAQFNEMKNSMGIVSEKMKENADATQKASESFRKSGNAGSGFGNKMGKISNVLSKLKLGLLSVLFFMMALKNATIGLLKPAAESFGIFELWGTTLEVLFLPIMSKIMPIFLNFVTFLMDLPEGVKLAIGIFVVFIAILASIAVVITMVVLFLASLPAIAAAGITAAGVAIAALVAFLISLVVLFWEDIKGGWDIVVAFFKNSIAIIISAFKEAGKQIKKVFKSIGDFISKVWKTISNKAKTAIDKIKSVFKTIANWFKTNVTNPIKNAFVSIWTKAKSIFDKIISKIKTVVSKMKDIPGVSLIGDVVGGVKDFFAPKKENDFVMRPGQGAVSINPNDTLVGFKGNNPFGGGETSIVQNISISGSMEKEVKKIINESNKRLVDDVRRLSGVRGV